MNWIAFAIVILVLAVFFVVKRMSFVPAKIARELLQKGAPVVDVRTAGEFRSGHLSRAVNIPLDELAQSLPGRFPDKDQPLLLHCLSGARSGMAARQLRAMGYRRVFNLGSCHRAQKLVGRAGLRPGASAREGTNSRKDSP